MSTFDPDELDEIVLSHFGDEEPATCPHCGCVLQLKSKVIPGFGLQLQFRCPECSRSGEWQQPQPVREWKTLHLEYFRETLAADRPIRCPIDDSYITYAEFENKIIQFVCPYCNRRGAIDNSD